jgi:vacuolar-type H+-ATPase subunit F/Vma7
MTGMALVADKKTATCFKLAGLRDVYSVNDSKGAEKCIQALFEKNDLKFILVSERLLAQVKITEKTKSDMFPLIIPIPDINDPKVPTTDRIVELIKRQTGIEVKF